MAVVRIMHVLIIEISYAEMNWLFYHKVDQMRKKKLKFLLWG